MQLVLCIFVRKIVQTCLGAHLEAARSENEMEGACVLPTEMPDNC